MNLAGNLINRYREILLDSGMCASVPTLSTLFVGDLVGYRHHIPYNSRNADDLASQLVVNLDGRTMQGRPVLLILLEHLRSRIPAGDDLLDELNQLYQDIAVLSEDSDQSPVPVPMTPAQFEELKAALLSAFPSPGSLQQVVAFKLGENLPVIAGGNNYGEIVFNLIEWTEANGRTEDLIVGARQMNPGNARLRRFEELYRIRHAK